jgi:hypothetical protein
VSHQCLAFSSVFTFKFLLTFLGDTIFDC